MRTAARDIVDDTRGEDRRVFTYLIFITVGLAGYFEATKYKSRGEKYTFSFVPPLEFFPQGASIHNTNDLAISGR